MAKVALREFWGHRNQKTGVARDFTVEKPVKVTEERLIINMIGELEKQTVKSSDEPPTVEQFKTIAKTVTIKLSKPQETNAMQD